MSSLQFSQVSLNALAVVSDEGKHITRLLSFADGHQKVLGCILGFEGASFSLVVDGNSSQRIEITEGECEVRIDDNEPQYYREGQSFVVASGTSLSISTSEQLQYIRHLEG